MSAVFLKPNQEYFAQRIKGIRDEAALNFPYKGIVIKLTDSARIDLDALFSLVSTRTNIPDSQVMADWTEDGYDVLQITAGDLRNDGDSFITHRQKCFTAAKNVDLSKVVSVEDLQEKFQEQYDKL